MDIATALFVYGATLGWCVDYWLRRTHTLAASPRLGLIVSHAVTLGVILAFAGGTTLLAHDVMEHGLAWLLDADKALLHAAYAEPGEVPRYWNASVLLPAFGIAGLVVSAHKRRTARKRVAHAHHLVVTRRVPFETADGTRTELAVCDSPHPAVYCLPEGPVHRRIHISTGAMDLLDERELRAAIEHEQGHLVRRHHLMTLYSDTASALFRWTGMLRNSPATVRELVELDADDFAAERHGAEAVASALLRIAAPESGGPSEATIALSGGDPAARIRRLLGPGERISQVTAGVLTVMALAGPTVPAAAVLAPAIQVAGSADTPPPTDGGFVHHS